MRRRPSIHRSWNEINLTDDQKHTKMSDKQEHKSGPNTPVLRLRRVSKVENEDSANESDHENSVDNKGGDLSMEAELEADEEHLEASNASLPSFNTSDIYDAGNMDDDFQAIHDQEKSNADSDVITLAIILFSLFSVLLACWTYDAKESFDLQSIKESFPTQDDDLWVAFESGVEDVVLRGRPSTFILLYEDEAREVMQELVYKLSKFAACNITDCEKEPIEITDAELNSARVLRDYGTVIEKYRHKLQEKGVMVIKNLENVRGTSAQAFHSFCDEFTPLVQKSLFIFTMKVDQLPRTPNKMKFIEEYFKRKWTDIRNDTFNALITRITSMVLEIKT